MDSGRGWRRIRLLALAALTLSLAACGSSEEAEPTVPATTATQAETAPPPPPAPPTMVRIQVRDGVPVGGVVRARADRNDRVVIVVTSDVRDHVHVHGYDLLGDVAPGSPARIAFRARIPGRFEIELEDRHVPIAELTVHP